MRFLTNAFVISCVTFCLLFSNAGADAMNLKDEIDNNLIKQTVIEEYEDSELYPFKHDKLTGYMDQDGNVVIQPTYHGGYFFSDGLAMVYDEEGDTGFINKKGELVIPFEFYSDSYSFSYGFALVEQSYATDFDDFYYIDKQGNEAFPKRYNGPGIFYDGYATVLKQGYRNWIAQELNIWTYINTDGEIATDKEFEKAYDFHNGYAVVKKNGAWGIINKNFQTVIDYKYDAIGSYSEGKLAVKKDEQWGYISIYGDLIIPYQYQDASEFSNGLASVMQDDGLWGYIDTKGNTVLPYEYEVAYKFINNKAVVCVEDKYGLIDTNGNFILEPQYKLMYYYNDNMIRIYDNDYNYIYVNINGTVIEPKI